MCFASHERICYLNVWKASLLDEEISWQGLAAGDVVED